jgi:hypothetical protein
MNETSVNVWTTPDGSQFEIPADIYDATTFRKDGWPDKRVKANAAFWAWLNAPKSPVASLEGADAVVPVINGDTSDRAEAFDAFKQLKSDVEANAIAEGKAYVEPSAAQAYANRVWAGQSVSADRAWRIQRVKDALAGQGLSFEGVELPNG